MSSGSREEGPSSSPPRFPIQSLRTPAMKEAAAAAASEASIPRQEPTAKRSAAGSGAVPAVSELEHLRLIDAVTKGKCVRVAVKHWVEWYEKDAKSATVELLMMLFESCGAKYQLHASGLAEIDVADVVHSLVELARNVQVEDLYNSKPKEIKKFKEHLSVFWEKLVLECQNGPLFDKVLFEKCMDYVIALSCSSPRFYRQVASIVGLQLVTSFIAVAETLRKQTETTQRQLNAAKKKQKDGPRVESLNKHLSLTHGKIKIMEKMWQKIFTRLFTLRYRDVDPDIRVSCVNALGVWIVSYPSHFLKDSYLKYLGWTLNDKSALVRKASVLALQKLYEVDANVPSLSLFTERFCNRMIELVDHIDVSLAVSAIRILKQLLRHQLLTHDELGPLNDLFIHKSPLIRHAIGELLYDHFIAQNGSSSQSVSEGEDDETSKVHLGRMLQKLGEFSDDPMLSSHVIDAVWDHMKAMKDWKCIVSILLDEKPMIVHTDADATNLVRLLYASATKAVGEMIVPSNENRKPILRKSQKEAFENCRHEITSAMMESYPQLLQKYASDKAKVSPLVEIVMLLKLELFSLERQEQIFKTILECICDAFFKHGEKDALRSCIKAITFCSTESEAELQDFAQNKLKELQNVLLVKLKSAMKEVAVKDDECSLLVNLKRLYEVQLMKDVSSDGLYNDMDDMASILTSLKDIGDEVPTFLLLNMFLQVAWSFQSIDSGNPSEASIGALLAKRNTLFQHLEHFLNCPLKVQERGRNGNLLASRICVILADMWCLFKESKYVSTKLESLGYSPSTATVEKFWKLCEEQLNVSDETEDEDAKTNIDIMITAAAKLVASSAVPKDYLGPEIISHFVMHGASVTEIIKHLIAVLKKNTNVDVPAMLLKALERAYQMHGLEFPRSDDDCIDDCNELATRMSRIFVDAPRN